MRLTYAAMYGADRSRLVPIVINAQPSKLPYQLNPPKKSPNPHGRPRSIFNATMNGPTARCGTTNGAIGNSSISGTARNRKMRAKPMNGPRNDPQYLKPRVNHWP